MSDQPTTQGGVFTIISILLSSITIANIQPVLTFIASVGSIVSVGMAIRYYHFATKKVKSNDK